MKNQKEYWDGEILDWEDSSYGATEPRSVSLVEKGAQLFRGPVRYRQALALQILTAAKPENVLELGCGSGRFATSLVTKTDICHVTGIDISGDAIQVAKDRAVSMKLTGKLSFIQSSVADLDFDALQPFDFVLGLGLTSYLMEVEFTHLFSSIKDTAFLFDIHPKGLSFKNLAHVLYRMIKGHPFYFQYTEEEIIGKLADLGISNVIWRQSQGVCYIQH